MMSDDERRSQGLEICRQFLGGSWKTARLQDFEMEHIRGGLSNTLYKCSLSDKTKLHEAEPRTVLIRFYGQIIHENPDTVLTDSVIFSLLAEKRMGPRLHGVFTGGRVEEYVPSRVLSCKELHDTDISLACARKMAQFHKLTMPIVKEPLWLFDTMTRYLDEALSNMSFREECDVKRAKLERLMSFGLATELSSLKSILQKVPSPVVFCHNDLQEGNILFVEDCSGCGDSSWQLQPIDFEYASYNYRGFDMGNHFCEWCYDYKYTQPPYFSAKLDNFPTREQQLSFIRAYLAEYHSADNGSVIAQNGVGQSVPSQPVGGDAEEEEALLVEVRAYALASHFLWGLWAIVQAHMSNIEFGYLDYALARFDAYFTQKKSLLSSNGYRHCNGSASTTSNH